MRDIPLKLTVRDLFGYGLAYLLWFLTLSVAMVAMLEVRNALNAAWPVLGSGSQWTWTLRTVDRFGLVFLGLVWLSYEILAEYRYRMAITAVRVRQFRGKKAPALNDERSHWALRYLARMGLDLLAPRFAVTILPPVAIWLVSYLVKQLAFRLLLSA